MGTKSEYPCPFQEKPSSSSDSSAPVVARQRRNCSCASRMDARQEITIMQIRAWRIFQPSVCFYWRNASTMSTAAVATPKTIITHQARTVFSPKNATDTTAPKRMLLMALTGNTKAAGR